MAVLSRRFLGPLALLAAVGLLAACDSAGPLDSPDTGQETDLATPVELGADFPEERTDGVWLSLQPYMRANAFAMRNGGASGLSFTELWLAGTQDGEERLAATYPRDLDRYELCAPTDPYDFFRLASGVEYSIGDWPVHLGAPLTEAGTPQVYGDLMAWNAYCLPAGAGSGQTLRDVRVNHALFFHEAPGLEGVLFLRFEITNLGSSPITDLRTGLYADGDVGQNNDYYRNLLGSTDRYAYIYTSAAAEDRGGVMALALLETPKAAPLAVRRIAYRDQGPAPGEIPFSETAVYETPATVAHALRGLDDTGDPIVDPTTGLATTFMFGGDPLAGTGWLDGTFRNGQDGFDIRVLQATAPITLGPGESVVLTAAAISTSAPDRAAGLSHVDAVYEAVAADPSLWQFPIAAP